MPPDSTILRYINVRELARRGEPGERTNAAAILSRMEADYPNIRQSVSDYEARRSGSTERPRPPAPNPMNPAAWDWQQLFQYGQAVVNGVSGFAQNVGNAAYGRSLADHVQASVRQGKTNNILLTIKITEAVYNAALDLNELQMTAFRGALHQQLDAMLDSLFATEEEEDP